MRFMRSTVALVAIALVGTATAAEAQESFTGSDEIEATVQEKVAGAEEDRDAIRSVLDRDRVRDVADRHGFDVDRAQAAVETLEGSELSQAADRARELDAAMANTDTVVISTTAIVIGLLIAILILVA